MLWLELLFILFYIYGGEIVEWSHNIGFGIQQINHLKLVILFQCSFYV
jgi:hypothetical protein